MANSRSFTGLHKEAMSDSSPSEPAEPDASESLAGRGLAAPLKLAAAISLAIAVGVLTASAPWKSANAPGASASGATMATRAAGQAVNAEEIKLALSTELVLVPEDEARKLNASIPFITRTPEAARSVSSRLGGLERDRAADCLAAAAWYEAGADADGQRAVMQVVLNRTRNGLFPNSVCEVVFQGSERATGCQFTFTCDGAMTRRRPSAAAWSAARKRADAMLAGQVFKPVGYATHYHTDWVMPRWNRNLDKIAQIDTHLFYRWRAGLGTARAFRHPASPTEPSLIAMAALSQAHRGEEALMAGADAPGGANLLAANAAPPDVGSAEHTASFAKTRSIATGTHPGRLAIDAVRECEGEKRCFVAAYESGAAQPHVRLAALSSTKPDFLYVQVLRDRKQAAYWNCDRFPREQASECIPDSGVASLLPRSE